MADAAWTRSRRSDAFDLGLAVLFAGAGAISLHVAAIPDVGGRHADYSRIVAVPAMVALCLALVVRRRVPLAALVVGTAGLAALRIAVVPENAVSSNVLLVLLYTAGAYGGSRRDVARWFTALTVAGLVVSALVVEDDSPLGGEVSVGLYVLFFMVSNLVFLVSGWLLGDLVRRGREREAELAAQAAALAAAQEERATQAVLGERLRIARELHDVLAQHVSVMGVQAAAARRIIESRPDDVPALLAAIESAGRDAVVELHRLLGLLRDHETGDALGPRPTLAEVPALARQLGDAGLAVDLDLDGAVAAGGDAELPAGLQLSAYRITQEALTNALKHGGPGTSATVALHRRAAALELVVRDDGRGSSMPASRRRSPGPGHGLVGMRERAALHGGELKAGRRPGGGYEVRAWFPLATGDTGE
jgi:signal transduction histidine kinase